MADFESDPTPQTSDGEIELLRKIAKATADVSKGTSELFVKVTETPEILTPVGSTVTATGSVAAGKKSITFIAGGTFSGTVAGGTLNPGESITFTAPTGYEISEVAYVVTTGSLRIFSL